MTIGSQIKAIREKSELTQKEFAKRIGLHPISLSKIENDKTMPRAKTIEKIIDTFGTIEDQAELAKSFIIENGKKKVNLFCDLLSEISRDMNVDISNLKSADVLDIYDLVEIIIKNRLKKLLTLENSKVNINKQMKGSEE